MIPQSCGRSRTPKTPDFAAQTIPLYGGRMGTTASGRTESIGLARQSGVWYASASGPVTAEWPNHDWLSRPGAEVHIRPLSVP